MDASHADRLRYLAGLGLKPGTRLTVIDQQPFHGPLTIRTEAQDHVIGHELATAVLCAPATVQAGEK